MLRSSLNLLAICRRVCSSLPRSSFSAVMSEPESINSNPLKAYVRHLKEEQRIEIRIHYADQSIDLERWFSFNRSLGDTVQQITERITTNLDRACLKSHKKKQKSIKKGQPNDPPDYKLQVDLKQNGEPLKPELLCEDLLQMENVFLTVNNYVYQLDINPPMVLSVKLPSSAMAGFNIYPTKLEVESCDTSQCEFVWFKSPPSLKAAPDLDSTEWIQAGQGVMYTVSNTDIGCWLKLKCIPKVGDKEGLPAQAVTSQAVEAGPGPCPFEVRHQFTKERVDASGYLVVSFKKQFIISNSMFVTASE